MTHNQVTYVVFGILLGLAIIVDLGLLSKTSVEISIKKALHLTIFWIILALFFFSFLWIYYGHISAVEYISAYLMEWSLSIDNIFVFILIFTFFKIRSDHIPRALLTGILLAIGFRTIFITIGIGLIIDFSWILYVFGAFLLYTGIKMFTFPHKAEFKIMTHPIYRSMRRFLPIIDQDIGGKMIIKINGKRFYTNLFLVIVLLACADLVFAVDSIPAVLAISHNRLIIYSSNIFAVLGLRSLFFLLKGAVHKFNYLQQGIALILIFVGLKMLLELLEIYIPSYISLIMITICLFGSIAYSIQYAAKRIKEKL